MKRKREIRIYSVLRTLLMRLLCAGVCLGITQGAYAQSDMVFSQHWALPTLYNPAATGDSDFLRVRGGARLQWIGVTNAPKSFVATGDMPFMIGTKRIGAGLSVSQESIGLFSNLLIAAQGSYKLKFLRGTLGIGLQIGYYNSRFKGSEVILPDADDSGQPDDPAIPTRDLTGNAADFSIGVNYLNKYLHLGISALHLTSPRIGMSVEGTETENAQQYETQLKRTLYFTADGNIGLQNSLFQVQPSLLMATDFTTWSTEISMRAIYNRFLSVGVGYRWKDAIAVMIGAEYKNFFLGYSYDYPLSALSKASSGSHELVAGYQLKLDLSGKNKHKHRSIRIM